MYECWSSTYIDDRMMHITHRERPEKTKVVGNYRPIACLPLMWDLLTSIFSEAMYEHLNCQELLPNEQKGCRKNSRGTKDQLLIDKAVLTNCRRRIMCPIHGFCNVQEWLEWPRM